MPARVSNLQPPNFYFPFSRFALPRRSSHPDRRAAPVAVRSGGLMAPNFPDLNRSAVPMHAGEISPLSLNAILLLMPDALHTPDAANPDMIYIKIPVGMLQCNCSIIGDPKTHEAIVVDPGDEVERILSLLGRYKLSVKAIVSTHAHIDHVGGLAKLYQYTGAPVMMHNDDLPLYNAMEVQAAFLGMRPPELTAVDQLLKDGDSLEWGGYHADVLHTPGHTPGSVCLFLPKEAGTIKLSQPQLFAGDTLFAGSIGRTD